MADPQLDQFRLCAFGVIADPTKCITIASLTAAPTTTLPDYFYTSPTPTLAFNPVSAFTSSPVGCEKYATYTCTSVGPDPSIDMCTEGTFDYYTHEYSFASTDLI